MQKDALPAFYPPQHFFVLVRGVVVDTAVPLEPYENGPGTPWAGMMGL